ncbi:FkbM family methyltransferase [Polynucleobacter sp. AP-Ainpum-60-G11]|uniref:FkbM family methyltransferase n=1 Tax=Polynucleobacter sp. AP-Ainpum-60-G11 TaxID=2576926 RepID=UPI001BFD99FC|nr:FkbM family methyltransferase [Polynucleobacter sp. AP-Ainpum-60-G11]QWE27013.1 FkbM family methyltransferase [Polynucleobacter sp. AP-Ainpum-60-G11]
MKKLIKNLIQNIIRIGGYTKLGKFLYESIIIFQTNNYSDVRHRNLDFKFLISNQLNKFRVETFSTKEPETLEWIDAMEDGSVLWDVGANIGLYSCYAAKAKKCNVYAFEPSVFNLESLAKNIYINSLEDSIRIVPIPLTNSKKFDYLNMGTESWGGALSSFGENYGWDGKPIKKIFNYQLLGMSIDEIIELLKIQNPDYIKIDVDGIEHLILEGAAKTLKNVRSILIEVNDNFYEQSNKCNEYLLGAGFVMIEKRHSEMFNSIESFGGGVVWNQIWARESMK